MSKSLRAAARASLADGVSRNHQMFRSLWIGSLLLLGIWPHFSTADLEVAGYLPDYRFYINMNQTALHLTDLYLFSMEINPNLGERMLHGCCLDRDHFAKAEQAAMYKKEMTGKDLRRWVTLGGGGRSEGFRLLKDQEILGQFIKAIKSLSAQTGIVGIDFDNEALRSRDDVVDFFRMIVAVSPVLQKSGMMVSMAIHVGFTVPLQVHNTVDRINVMTYDLPFARIEQVEAYIDSLLKDGIPSTKLFLGIPAYGRHQRDFSRVMTFAEITDAAGSSVFGSVDGVWNDFEFDSPTVVRQKVQLAREKHLGGVFVWELGQDKQLPAFPSGVLLEAMKQEADLGNTATNEL
jgi:GH18 family chitinase